MTVEPWAFEPSPDALRDGTVTIEPEPEGAVVAGQPFPIVGVHA